MTRRFPVVATVVVLIAVGVMIRLGVWQLDRLHRKEAMLTRYQAAMGAPLLASGVFIADEAHAYRREAVSCRAVLAQSVLAGRNDQGVTGWAQLASCKTVANARSAPADIVIGWSQVPEVAPWQGGEVTGTVVPGGSHGYHLVADPPLAGLAANARPDPRDLPNNHLSYAVQWFLFAATALVIYGLSLRKRLRGE